MPLPLQPSLEVHFITNAKGYRRPWVGTVATLLSRYRSGLFGGADQFLIALVYCLLSLITVFNGSLSARQVWYVTQSACNCRDLIDCERFTLIRTGGWFKLRAGHTVRCTGVRSPWRKQYQGHRDRIVLVKNIGRVVLPVHLAGVSFDVITEFQSVCLILSSPPIKTGRSPLRGSVRSDSIMGRAVES
jgi:hypothetical protein